MTTNIYILEDHPLIRNLLYEFINKLPGIKVCGTASKAQEALDQLPNLTVDLAFIDLSLPDMNGIDFLRILRFSQPNLRCIILSSHSDHWYVQQTFTIGARGYMVKSNPHEITEAIQQVLIGKLYLSHELRAKFPNLNQ